MSLGGDALRWAFWVHLRQVVDPDDPGALRTLGALAARLQYTLSDRRRRIVVDELRRTFPDPEWTERCLDRVVRSSYELHVQCLVEELLLDQLDAQRTLRFIDFEGREHLDAALADGRGVVLVYPHAGAVMLMIALLGFSGIDYVQVAARGFPPAERQVVDDVRPTWFNRRVRDTREAAEDQLPAQFVTVAEPARTLFRALERNAVVGLAFDGRGGTRFDAVPFLGRTANLSSGPWRIATATGATVLPAMCIRRPDRTHRLCLAPPVRPDPTLARVDAIADLRTRALAPIEAWLRLHPDHYARWLAHCRVHAAMDDHPLFA